MNKEPNFIIAGGVATGTGFLSLTIKDHPQLYLPKIMRPECGFFYKSWEFEKGKKYYLNKWFDEVNDEIAIGERSSLYLHGDFNHVAKRIKSIFPEIKLVFCLRNPTQRAYANYRFTVLTGFENLGFEEALEMEENRKKNQSGWKKEILPNLYRERGCYYNQLIPFFEEFDRDQLHFIRSDVLAKDTKKIIGELFNFLNIKNEYMIQPQQDVSAPNVKNAKIQTIFKRLLGSKLDDITEGYRHKKNRSLLSKIVALNLMDSKYPMMERTKKKLDEFYAPHNEKLSNLLNWDLSDWK